MDVMERFTNDKQPSSISKTIQTIESSTVNRSKPESLGIKKSTWQSALPVLSSPSTSERKVEKSNKTYSTTRYEPEKTKTRSYSSYKPYEPKKVKSTRASSSNKYQPSYGGN